MLSSTRRAPLRALLAFLALVTVMALSGCADVITYARKSNEEGMRLYHEKMYSDAAGAFRNAIRQDPRHYQSHFYLGVCYEEMKMYQQAFQEYWTTLEVMSQTLEGKDDDEFRRQALDTLAAAIARNDEREVELNKVEARAKQSQKAEDWFLLAKIHRLRGDADSAIDAYRRACKWDIWDFHIRKEFGLYLLDPLNQTRDAEYYLRQAFRLEPNDPAVNDALARLGITPPPAYKAKEEPLRDPSRHISDSSTVQMPRD